DFRSKNDDQVAQAAQLFAQLLQRVVGNRCAGERTSSGVVTAQERCKLAFASSRDLEEFGRLAAQLDGLRVHHVKLGAVQANVGPDVPGQKWMLLGGIVADQQNRRR